MSSAPQFTGNPHDLDERVEYELSTIEYLRATLHGQTEKAVGSTRVTLGDVRSNGKLKRILSIEAEIGGSDDAVRAALNQIRPLAFGASFKLQDMIVEWILHANGNKSWRFSDKIGAYEELQTAGKLLEPPLFAEHTALSRAFWNLYKRFYRIRNSLIHSGGVVLCANGTVSVTHNSETVNLSPEEQASYMRATCLAAKILGGKVDDSSFLRELIESDLFLLQKYHEEPGLVAHEARLEALTVHVPPSEVMDREPVVIEIDFDLLRQTMERDDDAGPGGSVYFSTSIIVRDDTRELTWNLPFENLPQGHVQLTEGDPGYDPFLRIRLDVDAD